MKSKKENKKTNDIFALLNFCIAATFGILSAISGALPISVIPNALMGIYFLYKANEEKN